MIAVMNWTGVVKLGSAVDNTGRHAVLGVATRSSLRRRAGKLRDERRDDLPKLLDEEE